MTTKVNALEKNEKENSSKNSVKIQIFNSWHEYFPKSPLLMVPGTIVRRLSDYGIELV